MAIAFLAILAIEYRAKEVVGMRRRKATTMQINVRLDTKVVDQLEERARANRISFSEEARQRLIGSLDPKPDELPLADYRGLWLRQLRDGVETIARQEGENIEEAWGILQLIDAEFSKFYGYVETKLSPYVRHSAIRQLLRGSPAPVLPDETKASKVTQRE